MTQREGDVRKAVGSLTTSVVETLVETYLLMLTSGAVHSFIPRVPAFGFGQIFLLLMMLGVLAGSIAGDVTSAVLDKVRRFK